MSEIVKLFKKFHCKNRTPSEPLINFKEQNFEFLLAQHNSENLFEDPEFPADFSSLTGFGSDFPTKEIIWKRPTVNKFKIKIKAILINLFPFCRK